LDGVYDSFYARAFNGTALSSLSVNGSSFGFWDWIFEAQAGQTYAIQVLGRSHGTFTLNIAPLVQPPNDHFTNAFVLTGTSPSATGIGAGATFEPGEQSPVFNNPGSLWWNWTAPTSGRVTVSSSASVGVYTGDAVNNLTRVLESGRFPDNSGFLARAGTTYRIGVYARSAQPFQFWLTAPAPPPSPELASMRRLSNGTFEFQFNAITGQTNVIEVSSDLLHWIPISTNFLDCGILNVLDPTATGFPHRFYRLRLP
jgi:hypothetical protein